MKKLTYLAVLEPSTDGGFGVYFPDLPGCTSFGDDLIQANQNAKEALELHVYGMEKDSDGIPEPSVNLDPEEIAGCIVTPVTIFPEIIKNEMNNRRVKTNCTIPAWLKAAGEAASVNFSQLLEESLIDYLNVKSTK